METKIISEDQRWKSILTMHERAIPKLQFVVNSLVDAGLTVTTENLKDLVNYGAELADQVGQIVAKESKMFKIPGAREKFAAENRAALLTKIADAKQSLEMILQFVGLNPLEIDAFIIEKTTVLINEAWLDALRERYLVRESESREKALELIGKVEIAINELNNFVEDNPNFGKGISTFADARRCLCYLDEAGNLIICKQELQLIN